MHQKFRLRGSINRGLFIINNDGGFPGTDFQLIEKNMSMSRPARTLRDAATAGSVTACVCVEPLPVQRHCRGQRMQHRRSHALTLNQIPRMTLMPLTKSTRKHVGQGVPRFPVTLWASESRHKCKSSLWQLLWLGSVISLDPTPLVHVWVWQCRLGVFVRQQVLKSLEISGSWKSWRKARKVLEMEQWAGVWRMTRTWP